MVTWPGEVAETYRPCPSSLSPLPWHTLSLWGWWQQASFYPHQGLSPVSPVVCFCTVFEDMVVQKGLKRQAMKCGLGKRVLLAWEPGRTKRAREQVGRRLQSYRLSPENKGSGSSGFQGR